MGERRERRLGLALVSVFLFGLLSGVALREAWQGPLTRTEPGARAETAETAPTSPTGRLQKEPVTGASTRFVFQTRYRDCRQVQTEETPARQEWQGLTEEEVRVSLPNWRITQFSAARVVLEREGTGPCPDWERFRTIGLRDGRVVVFRGRPENLGPVVHETGIEVTNLPPADRERLSSGIVVDLEEEGEAAVWRYLEGLPGV